MIYDFYSSILINENRKGEGKVIPETWIAFGAIIGVEAEVVLLVVGLAIMVAVIYIIDRDDEGWP